MKLKLKKSAHIPVQKMCNAIKSIASGLKAQLTDWDYVEQEQHHGGHISSTRPPLARLPPASRPPLARLSSESHLKRLHSPHFVQCRQLSLHRSTYTRIYIYIYISYIYGSHGHQFADYPRHFTHFSTALP